MEVFISNAAHNEVSELQPNRGLAEEVRRKTAEQVSNVHADAFRLLINVQGIHWNAQGPLFYSLHQLTENQYEDLGDSIDDLAERVRALGLVALESLEAYQERSVIDDLPKDADLKQRVARLISDYERATERAAKAVNVAEEHGDVMTADLLTERIGVYEENAWMLRATLAES